MKQKEIKPERFFEGVPDRVFEKIDYDDNGIPKPKEDKPMFSKIWSKVKKVATNTLLPIISNEMAIDKLLPFIKKNLDVSVRVYDKDSDGDTELVIRVLFRNTTILIREIKI